MPGILLGIFLQQKESRGVPFSMRPRQSEYEEALAAKEDLELLFLKSANKIVQNMPQMLIDCNIPKRTGG